MVCFPPYEGDNLVNPVAELELGLTGNLTGGGMFWGREVVKNPTLIAAYQSEAPFLTMPTPTSAKIARAASLPKERLCQSTWFATC